MNPAHSVLVSARALISTPAAWTHGHFLATNAAGEPVREHAADAAKWTLSGALWKVAPDKPGASEKEMNPARIGAWKLLAQVIGCGYREIDVWNDADGRTHAEVLKVLDEAIKRSGDG